MGKLSLDLAEESRLELTKEQQKQIQDMYQGIAEEIGKRAESLPNTTSGALRSQYLKKLQSQINEQLTKLGENLGETIKDNMFQVSLAAIKDNMKWLESMGMPISGLFSHVPADVVNSVITGKVYSGNWSLSKAIWNSTEKAKQDINRIIASGIAQNKGSYEIAKDLEKYVNPKAQKEWDWSKVYPGTNRKVDYNAQRLARTLVSHAYQQSFIKTTRKNPFVTKYKWLTSNSHRVCPLCASREGRLYDKDELPMDHPMGMCTFVALIEDSMEDVANRLVDWAEGKSDPALDAWAKDLGYSFGETKSRGIIPDNLPGAWKEVLGNKTLPYDIDDCLRRVNPNYGNYKLKYSLYHENCQRCVTAYELRRRGYNVTAKAFDGSYPDLHYILKWNQKDFSNYVMSNTTQEWFGGDSNNPHKMGRGASGATKSIVEAMTRWGPGSRATLSVAWRGKSSAHVINVENVDGVITLIDAQCGKKVKGTEAIKHYMAQTTASGSLLVRTDHLDLKTEFDSALIYLRKSISKVEG